MNGFPPWKSAALSSPYLCLSVSICGCIAWLRLSALARRSTRANLDCTAERRGLKSDNRNPKPETNPKHQQGNDQNYPAAAGFEHWAIGNLDLFRVSTFGFPSPGSWHLQNVPMTAGPMSPKWSAPASPPSPIAMLAAASAAHSCLQARPPRSHPQAIW